MSRRILTYSVDQSKRQMVALTNDSTRLTRRDKDGAIVRLVDSYSCYPASWKILKSNDIVRKIKEPFLSCLSHSIKGVVKDVILSMERFVWQIIFAVA